MNKELNGILKERLLKLQVENEQLKAKNYWKDEKIKRLKEIIKEVYQMGIESTFSVAKGMSRDKRLEKILSKL